MRIGFRSTLKSSDKVVPFSHYLQFALVKGVRNLVLSLPLAWNQRIGSFLGGMMYHLLSSRRRIALDNLRHAFSGQDYRVLDNIARASFRNYGIMLFELLWFPNITPERIPALFRVHQLDLVREAHSKGNGVILLTGHFGNWELFALATGWQSGIPLNIIVQTQSNRLVDSLLNSHRTILGNRVTPMGMSIREILKTMREGGIVAVAADQSGAKESVYVEFFGRSVATHQGPAVFALKSGAPVFVGFPVRNADGSYDATFEPVKCDDLNGATPENIIELTTRITKLTEDRIRRHPDLWLWMHRRWKHLAGSEERIGSHAA